MFGWYDPSHTHTHTHTTLHSPPTFFARWRPGRVPSAAWKTPSKKHHPTPSNELQRNSAGEHWINRSPHKWQPATTIITACINTYSAIWHDTTTKTSHRSIHITAASGIPSMQKLHSPISKQISDNRCVDYIQSRSISPIIDLWKILSPRQTFQNLQGTCPKYEPASSTANMNDQTTCN